MKIFFYVFMFFSTVSWTQEPLNQTDSKGLPHGKWLKKYDNGNIRYQGTFDHGKEIGLFVFYAYSGSEYPIATKEYSKDKDLVKVTFYNEKGVLESQGMMIDKKREGLWKFYFSDGKTLMSEENYKNGLLHGKVIVYYKNGKPTEIANYEQGKLHGNRKRYDKKGSVLEDYTFHHGIMHGPAVIYDKEGKQFARGNYKDGLKSGVWEFFMDGVWVSSDAPEKIITPKKIGTLKN